MDFKKITIVGAGYVGFSLACLLSQEEQVTLVEKSSEKVDLINRNESPIKEDLIQEYQKNKKLKINATTRLEDSFNKTDLYILALPTNYDEKKNYFDTKILENEIKKIISEDKKVPILIKSTIPVGFCERISKLYPGSNIIFSPEFLREGSSLHDNIYPSRIVIGSKGTLGRKIGNFLHSFALNDPDIFYVMPKEAESIKLFSNSYLAMRVSFFNELDSFCMKNNLKTVDIINSICSDPRIRNGYNNPSFGYGGYCLPKDTKQLLANYEKIPQSIIAGIVEANSRRKDFIADTIIDLNKKTVGIYRLAMKEGSDNLRDSSIQGIIKRLNAKGLCIYIYEPLLFEKEFFGCKVISDLDDFKDLSELIVANRMHTELDNVQEKIFTRDIFSVD